MDGNFQSLRELISKQKKIIIELNSSINYYKNGSGEEKKIILNHIQNLMNQFKKSNSEINEIVVKINLHRPLKETGIPEKPKTENKIHKSPEKRHSQYTIAEQVELEDKYSFRQMKPDKLEKETFKRIMKKNKEKKIKKKDQFKEVNPYVKFANKLFRKFSKKLVDDKTFETLERDLIKANMQFTGQEYLSVLLLSTIVSIFIAGIVIAFFLFFNIGPDLPIITRSTEDIGSRLIKVFWLIFVVPAGTMIIMFLYPTIEKNSAGNKMDQEMPFATMHMSAISGSMINPVNIFEILISTKEYPNLSKQFTKLINETNIYGYDIVSALRISAVNCPSKKLSELYTGLATTISSGGALPEFFEKRSETLLFEYNLEKEKRTKGAETFMDIYISVVIAAPMILMILLMMIKISGLGGISLSTSAITLIMIISVTVVNIIFLSFLEVKK